METYNQYIAMPRLLTQLRKLGKTKFFIHFYKYLRIVAILRVSDSKNGARLEW